MSSPVALISVWDKTGIVELATGLVANGWAIWSTGGTASTLRESGIPVDDVSSVTGQDELLGGRVKTLHPAIHAGILATDSTADQTDLATHGFRRISLVVVNLYPFSATISDPSCTFSGAIEQIDIGGVALLRAAAKNHDHVTVCCDPRDYAALMDDAFEHTASYDESISGYLRKEVAGDGTRLIPLKYGMNPNQSDASFFSVQDTMPVKVLNGSPGYVNILDALNGWQLVKELSEATGMPAAASFKHVSPAGAAIGIPLNEAESQSYLTSDLPIDTKKPSLAAAYARARGADRMSSFGDLIALSDRCDELTARVISREVSDGVIAPDYDPAALSLLVKKKGGNYTVFKIDPKFLPSETEERTIFGLKLRQKRNTILVNASLFSNIVGKHKELPKSSVDDLIVATIAIKYAQSNSVCIAYRGQVIGLGSGQQSRIHCTRLAGDKAANWWLRQHPKLLSLPWRPNLKRSERATAVELLATAIDSSVQEQLAQYFTEPVVPFTPEERSSWLSKQSGSALSSDAFFPFRDNVLCAAKCGVRYIAHPGGSSRDADVTLACDEHGITLVHTGVRLFHH